MTKRRDQIPGITSIKYFVALVAVLAFTAWTPGTAATNEHVAAVQLNNEGVTALNKKEWQSAIDKLTAALKIDPNYSLARDNLVIAHDKYGEDYLKNSDSKEALKQFHQSIYSSLKLDVRPSDHAQVGLDKILALMNKDPKSFSERVAMADQAKANGDTIGAQAEYYCALQIKDDLEIQKKLAALKSSDRSWTKTDTASESSVDHGPYMAALQRRIKRAWTPPKGHEGSLVSVTFKVHKDGSMTNLKIERSSGDTNSDQLALKAVESSAPFDPLPPGDKEDIDIQYFFKPGQP